MLRVGKQFSNSRLTQSPVGHTQFDKFELRGNPHSTVPPTGPILEHSWILRKHQSPLRLYPSILV